MTKRLPPAPNEFDPDDEMDLEVHQAAPPATGFQPARRAVPRASRPGKTQDELFYELENLWIALKRASAGYRHLKGALESYEGRVPQDERAKGLPVFTFPASVTGRDSIDVVVDLKRIDPAYVGHVLVPLINAFHLEITDTLSLLQGSLQELSAQFTSSDVSEVPA